MADDDSITESASSSDSSASSDSSTDSTTVSSSDGDSDSYTETESDSGGGGGSLLMMLFGLVLFLVSFPLLFWNEGRAVERYKTLKEGASNAISVPAEPIDRGKEGKLVHVTGTATTTETLRDPDFQVSVQAIRLLRVVKTYQWEEKKDSKSRTDASGHKVTDTTYSYHKVWSDKLINSGTFKKAKEHANPTSMPYPSREFIAATTTLGAYTLSPSLVRKMGNQTPVTADAAPPPAIPQAAPYSGGYYIGKDPAAPEIGDLAITFIAVKPAAITVVARQIGTTFEPYIAKTGSQVEELRMGTVSSQLLFQQEQDDNTVLTWILRAVGFVLMLFGLAMMASPLAALASFVPVLGEIVAVGTVIIAFLASAIFSMTTIAIAWLFYRPALSVLLFMVAAASVFLIRELYLRRKEIQAKVVGLSRAAAAGAMKRA